MQLVLPFGAGAADRRREGVLVAGRRSYLIAYVRVRRARHYIIRVGDDGRLRVTVPFGGSRREAERFVRERIDWIERERFRRLSRQTTAAPWQAGTPVLVGGEAYPLEIAAAKNGQVLVRVGPEAFRMRAEAATADLRPYVERCLRAAATRQLAARLAELAGEHGFRVAAANVRNQRSQWGACTPAGRITLNWRLVQLPPHVRDYVLLHELTHLRHLNHSRRFWAELERLCPGYREARMWLRGQRTVG